MQDRVRVDLIFPRSGQILPIYVPNSMLEWVARRNIQVLLSLYREDALSLHADYIRRMHLYPS